MIDAGCLGACLSNVIRTAIPVVNVSIVEAMAANDEAPSTARTESGVWTRDDDQWQTSF